VLSGSFSNDAVQDKRRKSFTGKNHDKIITLEESSYNKVTSIHLDYEYRPLHIMKVLLDLCGDPHDLSPSKWTPQQIKDFEIFFDNLSKLDKITKEIFENLYCKTKLNREWFQDKNSILCEILEKFNDFFVRFIPPLGTGSFSLADIMLLGTTQRIFKFLLIQNYRENNISELTQWFRKRTSIKEFKQTFGVAKFCVGSIDDLYRFNSGTKDKARKKRSQANEDILVKQSIESQNQKVLSPRENSVISQDDDTFDLKKFKKDLRNYFDSSKQETFKNNKSLKKRLENFDNELLSVFIVDADQDDIPEEGLKGFEFISKFRESGEEYLFYLYLYQQKCSKRGTIGRRIYENSSNEISESEPEIEKLDHEFCESNVQSENEQFYDFDNDNDQDTLMRGLLICKESEKLKEIREGLMLLFRKYDGVKARLKIEKTLFQNQKLIKDFCII
jgi:hypothetical protein